jgi:hypothetical protein
VELQNILTSYGLHTNPTTTQDDTNTKITWEEAFGLTVASAGPTVVAPAIESGRAYGTASALQLLKNIGHNDYGTTKATVFEVNAAGDKFRCTNVYVVRSTRDGVEIEIEGEQGSTRLPQRGWTVIAAGVGHHVDSLRNAAKH